MIDLRTKFQFITADTGPVYTDRDLPSWSKIVFTERHYEIMIHNYHISSNSVLKSPTSEKVFYLFVFFIIFIIRFVFSFIKF